MGASIAGSMPGGGGREGAGKLFQCGGAGGVALRGGDVGTYPKYGVGPGELPAQVRALDHQETTAEKRGQDLDVSSSEGGHERGRVREDSEGHHEEEEYGRAIHCDATNYGPL